MSRRSARRPAPPRPRPRGLEFFWLVALAVFAGAALYAWGYVAPQDPPVPPTWRDGHRWYQDLKAAD